MNYTRTILNNGLRVITIPMPSFESATVLVMVGAGSRYETKENSGISHFLEHMAFKGTKKRPSAMAISTLIDGIGGECNAFTGKEATGYYIKSANTHIDLSLDILSDMLTHSLFDEKEIDKERGVILEEINLYEDTPARKIGDVFERLLYGNTPMGWDISGEKDVIKTTKRDGFVKYMDSLYSSDNITVVVAGGINVGKTLDLVKKYFGGMKKFKTIEYEKVDSFIRHSGEEAWPTTPESVRQAQDKSDSGRATLARMTDKPGRSLDFARDDGLARMTGKSRVLIKYKKTEQAHIALGVRTVAINHPDRYILSVLSAILGGGMSSRLFHEVREKRGLGYYVRAHSEEYQDSGYLCTTAGIDPKRIDEAIEVVRGEYRKISSGKMADQIQNAELQKAKEYMKGHLVLEMEDSRSVGGFYASQELLEKRIDNLEEVLVKIDKVTKGQVLWVAQEYLTKPMQLAVIGDFEDKSRFQRLLE